LAAFCQASNSGVVGVEAGILQPMASGFSADTGGRLEISATPRAKIGGMDFIA
jgi:hypothetical protein